MGQDRSILQDLGPFPRETFDLSCEYSNESTLRDVLHQQVSA